MTWVDLEADGAPAAAAARLAAAEWRLAQHPWLVPRVGGIAPAGYRAVLDDGSVAWTVRLRADGAELCGAWAGCEPATDLDSVWSRLGLAPPEEPPAFDAADARDAATLYGLGPPRRRARGEAGPAALWIRARRQLAGGAPGRAVALLERASSREPGNVALRATLAAACTAAGRRAEAADAWARVDVLSPSDPRFLAPMVAAERAAGRGDAAEARLAALTPRLRALPVLAPAPAAGRGPAGPAAPPIHPVPGAAALRAEGTSPGQIDAALRTAGDPVALVARGEARLALGRPREALQDADRALAASPWLPEALALRAAALDTLGRSEEASQARADLRFADPGRGDGPRRLPNAREVGPPRDQPPPGGEGPRASVTAPPTP